MQYGNGKNFTGADFAGEGGFLYHISASLIFWEDDTASCAALNMLPQPGSKTRSAGSLKLLWPFFCSVLLSQFVETLGCALQGRQVMPENGLTIWEHSLAFAEAEATFTRPLAMSGEGLLDRTSRIAILQGMNAPPEVLVITLISSLSHLTSNILAVVGLRTKLRLINTGIWGMAYMFVLLWGFFRSTVAADSGDLRILRFPSVCLIGFVPHILIFASIIVCAMIYIMALFITAAALPVGPGGFTVRERMRAAYRNLQANAQLSTNSSMRLNYQEDFFTALLKIGFAVLTAASEAVFLNEGTRVAVNPMTWLEETRIREITTQRSRLMKRTLETVPDELRGDLFLEDAGSNARFVSGYARERKPDSAGATSNNYRSVERDNGVGFLRRGTKFTLSLQLLKGIWWLIVGFAAQLLLNMFTTVGLNGPAWLLRFVRQHDESKRRPGESSVRRVLTPTMLDYWVVDANGHMARAASLDSDLDAEARNSTFVDGSSAHEAQMNGDLLDERLYQWWKAGGRWADADNSGDYQPPYSLDDDVTSVISTVESSEGQWSDITDSEDGGRTPTQQSPYTSRQSTPYSHDLLDTERLASLLDPRSTEDQEEAQFLARHLRHDKIMTRSGYRKLVENERGRILTTSKYASSRSRKPGGPMSPAEEERALEQFLLERRTGATSGVPSTGASWDSGAEGMGSSGPQCVVCQASPRTILMWPCGCLSLCDDCRVGLATRNFDACVCCRRKVVTYSRMYVP
jgi:hypothetical protein